jgi:uncharacterized protein (DUF2141 family)
MTRFVTSFCLREWPARGLAVLTMAGLVLAAPLAAQSYGSKISNDMSLCEPGKGPAIRLDVTGLKSGEGNLFVRTYYARSSDWLKSRRYIHRIETRPRKGSTSVCVPLPAAGAYAITVQHDANGNRETDLSVDGAGVSNNPKFGSFLGIVPRPPAVDKARFVAGEGITRMSIAVQYQ